MTDAIPAWFWRLVAICTVGGTITLVTVGWSLGAFMSETQTWQKAQDERFFMHLDDESEARKELITAVRDVRRTVDMNKGFAPQFQARQTELFEDIEEIKAALKEQDNGS